MKHYEFTHQFRTLYDRAVALYAKGQRGADSFFTADERGFLEGNGLTAQNLYDYAEDLAGYGEPVYDQALAIELVRRDYFLNVQLGRPSAVILDSGKLPAKTDSVQGIAWLPRLLPKSRAKLCGELPSSLMYCCGGDRSFFKQHNLLPAEFLSMVGRHAEDQPVIDWVLRRSARA